MENSYPKDARDAMPLYLLIEFWQNHLGDDDLINPPNPLGEVIQETIYYLENLQALTP